MAQEDVFKKIVSHCKEYGFVFPSSEIYDGLAAVYDYGQNGVELKNNIKEYWWKSMVLLHSNIVGIDAAIFMHPTVWKASGHVDAFNDPLIDNRDSKKRYRADNLIEDQIGKYEEKIDKEVKKAAKRFGESFDEEKFRATNPRVLDYQKKRDDLHERYTEAMQGPNLEELKQIILDEGIVCPISGTKNWTDVRQFNLMFATQFGAAADANNTVYLRPETAQGIFVNYLNVQKTGRMKLPFGIAQIGKAFRNEIVARQFIFRMREFEQMEMQFFCKPGTEMEWFNYWKKHRLAWHQALGMGNENYRYHDHEKLAHYANAATDIEFHMPFGFKEVEGIHSRTDFDLSQHEKFSGRSIKYFDPDTNESYTPYDIETSIGVDRKIKKTGAISRNKGVYMELTSKQRAQLRGLANSIDTILQVGKDGIGANLIKQADDALEARELIKGRVLDNNIDYDARTAAEELAKATRSEVVQVIGTKFVLYRESHSKPREKRIQLVKPAKKRPQ